MLVDWLSAYLTVGSFTTWLHAYRLSMTRDIPDYHTRSMPLPPFESKLTVTFTAVSNPLLAAWISSTDMRLSGTVTLVQPEGKAAYVVNFSNALCIGANVEFVPAEFGTDARQTLILSPELVDLGLKPNFTSWPPVGIN